jgi:hypothetical protein
MTPKDIGTVGDTGRDPEAAKTGSTRFVVEWELVATTTTPQASAGDSRRLAPTLRRERPGTGRQSPAGPPHEPC